MNRKQQDFILSFLGVFVFFVAIASAFYTFLQTGLIPVLAFALKSFLLGSCLGTIALENRDKEVVLNLDSSFILGFGIVAVSSALLFANLLVFTTLFTFLVGVLFVYSGASSGLMKPRYFVLFSGTGALLLFILIVTQPALAPIYSGIYVWFTMYYLWVIGLIIFVVFLAVVCVIIIEWLG